MRIGPIRPREDEVGFLVRPPPLAVAGGGLTPQVPGEDSRNGDPDRDDALGAAARLEPAAGEITFFSDFIRPHTIGSLQFLYCDDPEAATSGMRIETVADPGLICTPPCRKFMKPRLLWRVLVVTAGSRSPRMLGSMSDCEQDELFRGRRARDFPPGARARRGTKSRHK